MAVNILGISAFYHDSAACLLRDGEIVAAAQEERFTRRKHDARFPQSAIEFCLKQGGISLRELRYVVFSDKPMSKFRRLLDTYLAFAPKSFRSYLMAMPVWMKEKLLLKAVLRKNLQAIDRKLDKSLLPAFLFTDHHESHAASAFYPSPFNRSAVLCLDGVGDWATTSAWMGEGPSLTPLWEITFPHSLGLLYSAFTHYTGFKVNSGEYEVMGLAPYGKPRYVQAIYDNLMDLKPDGTFRLNVDYFNYGAGHTMTSSKLDKLFDGPARLPEAPLTQREMDLARSVQDITEEVMLRLARTVQRETEVENLCLTGGVALNCVGNGRILREGPFKNLWIQPAAGDAGGAIGAAYSVWHQLEERPRNSHTGDRMRGSFLGPAFQNEEIVQFLNSVGAPYETLNDDALYSRVAEDLAAEKVVGWLQGPMEFGPTGLGGRSILGDPRSQKVQVTLNLKIKHRESFRPFAPSVLRDRISDYFEMDVDSPYMLLAGPVHAKRRLEMSAEANLTGIDLLSVPRSDIPAVTHVDYSARVQTVDEETNPRYYRLLKEFEHTTGCATLVNTSFNVPGEPIVCSPEDAFACFMGTEMDVLVLENCILYKDRPKTARTNAEWDKEFVLEQG